MAGGLRGLGLTLTLLGLATPGMAAGRPARSSAPPASPAQAQDRDAGDFEFRDARGRPDRPIHVWYARPRDAGPGARILFVMHGDSRTAQMARDSLAGNAASQGRIVVAPHFREAEYPGEVYDLGGMVDARGRVQPRADWALPLIEHLFDDLRERWSLTSTTYDIMGHSAGGQFVQRLVLFVPEARFRRAVASGPGTVAFPDEAIPAPYGLGGTGTARDTLVRALGRDFVLVVGDRDLAEGARPAAVAAQGKSRVSRALRLFATAHEAAAERGVPLMWRLRIVPGLDHSPLPTLAIDLEEILQ